MSRVKNPLITKEFFLKTALFSAANRNNVAEARELLSQGADVNVLHEFHNTPLHEAAWSNVNDSHFAVIELLLKSGADVNVQDNSSLTPLFPVVKKGSAKLLKLFYEFKADFHPDGLNLFFIAIEHNKNLDVLEFFIDLGFDVNQRNKYGKTPLIQACQTTESINLKKIKFLIKNGADVNGKSLELLVEALRIITTSYHPWLSVKKKFDFIIEQTDFNIIDKQQSDTFNSLVVDLRDCLWKWILEHIAKLQKLDIPVHEVILKKISETRGLKNYYDLCKKELKHLKKTKLDNCWITYYNLLVDDKKSLKNYAGNKDLIKDFKGSDCLKRFPIYGASIDENLKIGIKKRKLFDESCVLLSKCLPIFNPNHLVIRNVLDCITGKKDLSKFCEQN